MKSLIHSLGRGAAALALSLLAGIAAAAYPNGPVKIVVPSAPGGVTDPIARHIAEYLQRKWNSPVVVEHRPGAGGVTATAMMVKAPADGQMLVMANIGPLVFSPALYTVPYVVSKDIVPVGALVQFANVLLVNPNLPVKNVRDLIALAKSRPGTLNFASSGNGQSQHLTGEMFKRMAGVDIQHVAYKGTGPATTDLIGGQVQIMFGNIPSALPFVKDGKLRA
ncbi:MAG: tripartite tricarboxylate transporter substrate binding protein, partial [Burkholderiaceae bacterium]|nr:tripartite tricarboxylate transporter substrate binding protein [Burkholderiaceae bacterium]